MSEATKYDVIIIGAGQAGVPLARAFADAGKTTALIERKHIGGTCVNEGCTPTKTMAASAELAALAKRGHEFGVITGHVRTDIEKVRQRKRDMVESFMEGLVTDLATREKLTLIFGHAHFIGPKEIEVLAADGEMSAYTAPTIIINTGCRPLLPPIPGVDKIEAYDSTSIMEIDHIPEHLIVLGGGYVGVEFGQMFRRFGSRVTMLQKALQLFNREDKDVAKAVTDILREDGIRVLLGSEAILLEKGAEAIRVTISSSGMEMPMEGTDLLIAIGRTPNTDGLDLEATGVNMNERGFIEVNERLETSAPGIYAAGDVKGGPAFTHISYDDYRILRKNLLDGGSATVTGRMAPYVVFMDPQFARIGIGEDEARAKGMDIKVARLEMTSVARALESNRSRGFMKAIVDAKSDQILGYVCLGFNGGEIMAVVQTAMIGKLPYTILRDGIFAHPTLAESLNNLFARIE
jgi:pyruvate/2-oxoglutarate dehydrogenase complex dihydrolipoamide dehydrogenase (E3) component